MSGLCAARFLFEKGRTVAVLDKSRGVGGRVATRRQDSDRRPGWDHGAGFATFRHSEVVEALRRWGAWEAWRPWHTSPGQPGLVRHVCPGGINQAARRLAEGLGVHRCHTVVRLERAAGGWRAETEEGGVFQAGCVVLTPPAPQVVELLRRSELEVDPASLELLQAVRYDCCLTLLVECEDSPGLPAPGWMSLRNGHFDVLVDQQAKGVSTRPLLVAHAMPGFSREWYGRDRATAASILRAALQENLSSKIVGAQVHGWKFAHAVERVPAPCLRIAEGLFAAGDSFDVDGLPARVESALLSGIRCAEAVLEVS